MNNSKNRLSNLIVFS
ncbi:hypothetical protein YPPY32_2527, partial [Yersinia pestis PY-32]